MKTHVQRAQQLAEAAADRYFAALTAHLPNDTGTVNLEDACAEIQKVIASGPEYAFVEDPASTNEDAAFRAGYLIGVAVGRRLRL